MAIGRAPSGQGKRWPAHVVDPCPSGALIEILALTTPENDDALREVRSRKPGGAQILREMRFSACAPVSTMQCFERAWRGLLRRMRGRAAWQCSGCFS
jgi:hypothetical protein